MRLLYVTADCYPPFRTDVVELFAKQMPARGHSIDWLMQRGPDAVELDSPLVWLGNTVHLTYRSRRRGLAGRLLNNLLGIAGDLMILPLAFRGRYDVIQVRDKFFAGLVAWFAARLTGAKFVHWMSYPYAESKLYQAKNRFVPHHRLVWLKGQWIRFVLYKLILPRADHIFVQSERMKEDVAREGIDPVKMTAVPMGIKAEQVGRSEDARAPNSEAPILLHLGTIMRLRQSEMMVRVLDQVRKNYPKATLIYVGEGQAPSDRKAILDEAEKLGLNEAVAITGFLPMEQAWGFVKNADVCLSPIAPLPVFLAASPTKLVEYMAMARCVIANALPDQCEVMEQSGVGRCIPWSEEAFADEVCRLLDDPEAAREAAAKGPDWVRAHRTYDVIADKVDACYARLLSPQA